jgi:hypothetical protein
MKKLKHFLDYYSLLIVSSISVVTTLFVFYCLDKSVLTLQLIIKIATSSFILAAIMDVIFYWL